MEIIGIHYTKIGLLVFDPKNFFHSMLWFSKHIMKKIFLCQVQVGMFLENGV